MATVDNVTLKISRDTGDLVIGDDGIMETISGADTTIQNIEMTLKAWINDFPLVPGHGTRWENILGQIISSEEVEEEIRESVYQETDVAMVTEIEAIQNGRELNIDLKATTAAGEEIETEVTV